MMNFSNTITERYPFPHYLFVCPYTNTTLCSFYPMALRQYFCFPLNVSICCIVSWLFLPFYIVFELACDVLKKIIGSIKSHFTRTENLAILGSPISEYSLILHLFRPSLISPNKGLLV